MDVERLHVVLQQSFSADAAVRNPAEETIRNLKNLPGAVQLLLQVAAEKQVRSVGWFLHTCAACFYLQLTLRNHALSLTHT